MTTTSVIIPDNLRSWPWPRKINPYYSACKQESAAWCEGLKAFTPEVQHKINRCDFNLLASLAYPLLNKDGCRIGCDLMNLLYIIDEYIEVADIDAAREKVLIVKDALRNPRKPRSTMEWIGGEATRQFWENAIRTATPTAQARFIVAFESYLDSVVEQADDRATNRVRDVESYFQIRRYTSAITPSITICEIHMDILDEVIYHPVVAKLIELSVDAIIIANDFYSYNLEQARGDDAHNLVTIVMVEKKMDVQHAINWISELYDQIVVDFLDTWKHLPTFGGPLDREIRTFVDGLANWVRANDSWSFESERYFGTQGREVQRHRTVTLSPRYSSKPYIELTPNLPTADILNLAKGEGVDIGNLMDRDRSAGVEVF